ncbi:MAG: heme exporter protein CcmD [Steroidobacteraceae bacterium]|jgi:heme exporter protein CcmD
MSLREFLTMGAYGVYVWPCYGLTLAVLIWSAWSARRQLRNEILAARRRAQAQMEVQS